MDKDEVIRQQAELIESMRAEMESVKALRAEMESVKASNEQLKASNEQIKASNEQIKASNEQLKATAFASALRQAIFNTIGQTGSSKGKGDSQFMFDYFTLPIESPVFADLRKQPMLDDEANRWKMLKNSMRAVERCDALPFYDLIANIEQYSPAEIKRLFKLMLDDKVDGDDRSEAREIPLHHMLAYMISVAAMPESFRLYVALFTTFSIVNGERGGRPDLAVVSIADDSMTSSTVAENATIQAVRRSVRCHSQTQDARAAELRGRHTNLHTFRNMVLDIEVKRVRKDCEGAGIAQVIRALVVAGIQTHDMQYKKIGGLAVLMWRGFIMFVKIAYSEAKAEKSCATPPAIPALTDFFDITLSEPLPLGIDGDLKMGDDVSPAFRYLCRAFNVGRELSLRGAADAIDDTGAPGEYWMTVIGADGAVVRVRVDYLLGIARDGSMMAHVALTMDGAALIVKTRCASEAARLNNEADALQLAHTCGIASVPAVACIGHVVETGKPVLIVSYRDGTVPDALTSLLPSDVTITLLTDVGRVIAGLLRANLVHGDISCSNIVHGVMGYFPIDYEMLVDLREMPRVESFRGTRLRK